MKRLLLILALFCAYGISAYAQVHQDVISEDPDGVRRTNTLPTCDKSNVGEMKYVKTSTSAGFNTVCVNNNGYYMLQPVINGPGAIRHFVDFVVSDDYVSENSGAGTNDLLTDGDPDHPGVFRIQDGTVIGGWAYVSLISANTSTSVCAIPSVENFTTEYLFDPEILDDAVIMGIGMFSDRDNVNDTNMIFLEYDSNPQTVTDATNASPIVITTSAVHNYDTGDVVTISNVLGNTSANGTFTITDLTSTTFSLDGSTGNGAYISGGNVKATNWKAITRDGTGEAGQTKTDTGIAVASGTWYRLLIDKQGTTVEFYLAQGAAEYPSTPTAAHTTDVPNDSNDICPTAFIENLDTNSGRFHIDYMMLQMLGIER